MKILIGGDTVAGVRNRELFESGDAESLLGTALLEIILQYSKFVVNMEMPLICKVSPIKKNGPCLGAPAAAVKGYRAMGVSAVSLANNHIFDHGTVGLHTTLDSLNNHGIAYGGAGFSINEASKPIIFKEKDFKVGIYSCCENEFSAFSRNGAGANGFDITETFDQIRECADAVDYLIVLYHGGKEYYRYPTPMQQKIMRKMADCGAKLVVAQHSHCVGCEEEYHGSKLIYGQGNFLFDFGKSHDEYSDTGLLIGVEVCASEVQIHKIPVVRNDNTVRLADEEKAAQILQEYALRSEEITCPENVKQRFCSIVAQERAYLLRQMHGDIFPVKVFGKLLPKVFTGLFYGRKAQLAAQNVLECETHLECLRQAIEMSEMN